jgi:uncharacterized protein YjbI with pentapeptide repeats
LNDSKLNHVYGGLVFKNSNLTNVDFSYSQIDATVFDNIDLTTSNFSHAALRASQFIDSNLDGLHIVDAELNNASFKNSNVKNLKFNDSVLNNIIFDENTIFSSDIRNEIFLSTSFEPLINSFNYLDRVFKNQLIKHLGFVDDNPLSNFY